MSTQQARWIAACWTALGMFCTGRGLGADPAKVMSTRTHRGAIVAAAVAMSFAAAARGEDLSFAGTRVLVVQPENSWGWDSAIFGALLTKGFDVTYGPPPLLEDPAKLAQFELVATNIKRTFTPAQVEGIRTYLASGGALYGSWGGPMGCPEILKTCGIRSARSEYLREWTLLESPLAAGVVRRKLVIPEFMGHVKVNVLKGVETVCVEPAAGDAVVVARDSEGHSLGVLRPCGRSR